MKKSAKKYLFIAGLLILVLHPIACRRDNSPASTSGKTWTATALSAVYKSKIEATSPMGQLTKTPSKNKKLLEVVGTFSSADSNHLSVKASTVFVRPTLIKDKPQGSNQNKWEILGVGLVIDEETHIYHIFGTLEAGFATLTLPSGEGFEVGREKKEDSFMFTLTKNPSKICLLFEIPDQAPGPMSLHFGGTVFPISIKPETQKKD